MASVYPVDPKRVLSEELLNMVHLLEARGGERKLSDVAKRVRE